MAYNALMSYSHAADGKLAPALHSALHAFARPWYRLRALHIFRDKTTLAVTPGLWSSIKSALDQSSYFILLASPEAAASVWVRQEIEYWLERHPPDRILIVLTDGTLEWDRGSAAFRPDRTSALPDVLMRSFAEEPLYLDLRWARTEVHLSLRQPRFRDAVAELAAALLGRSKDELLGEDIRQYRRTRTLAWSAVAALVVLTLSSAIAAYVAFQQRDIAETQRAEAVRQSRVALARQLAAQSSLILAQFPDRLPLAVLLAVESVGLHDSFEGNQALRAGLSLLPRSAQTYPFVGRRENARVRALAFSPDGSDLAVAHEEGIAELLDLRQRKPRRMLYPDENPVTVIELTGKGSPGEVSKDRTEVTSVAFSPDGRLLATGSHDKTARVWETAGGRELLRAIHGGGVSSVAFSPTGKLLATGSEDGNARVLEIDTGREVIAFKHPKEVRKVAFSPDGRYLAAVSTHGSVSLSDMNGKEAPRVWDSRDADSGLGLAFSRDGKRLASANGAFAFVWDVTTGKELMKVTHANSPDEAGQIKLWVVDVAISPDGRYLASTGRDGTARVWSLATGQELIRLKHAAPVESVAFSPDGSMLSTAASDGTARLWEIRSGRETLRAVHPGGPVVAEFSRNGSQIASGGMDGAIHVWDLTRGDQAARMVHPADVRLVAFSPDGSAVATADDKGAIRLWSPSGELKDALRKPAWGPEQLIFDEDGRYLVVAARTPGLFVLDVHRQLAATHLPVFRNAGDRKALSPRYLAAVDRATQLLRIWETAGARELPAVKAVGIEALAFDSTGTFLATKEEDGHGKVLIRIWALPELRALGLTLPVESSSTYGLGPQGKYLAVEAVEPGANRYTPNRYVDVWDVAAAQRVVRIPQEGGELRRIVYRPDGRTLFTVSEGGEVRAWELPAGKLKARLSHEEDVRAIRFSADGNVLATVSEGRVYAWNASTGELLSQLTDAGYVRDVRFSPDGRYLLTGSADSTAALWLWKTEDLRDEACKRLTRNLMSSEWERYLGDRQYRNTCTNLPVGDQR